MATDDYNQRIDKMVNDLIDEIEDDCDNYEVVAHIYKEKKWEMINKNDRIVQFLCHNKKAMDDLDNAIRKLLGKLEIGESIIDTDTIPIDKLYKKTKDKDIVNVINGENMAKDTQYLYGEKDDDNSIIYFGKILNSADQYVCYYSNGKHFEKVKTKIIKKIQPTNKPDPTFLWDELERLNRK